MTTEHSGRSAHVSLPLVDECWRHIGISGDRSCAELLKVVHCRNCQVYSDGATKLFERPAPDGYIHDWTTSIADAVPQVEEQNESVVSFRLGEEWLGLPTKAAAFVASEVALRTLARRSNQVFTGLCLFLGELALAVSLRGLLGTGKSRTRGVRWIAMGDGASRWVFDVDELSGVVRYAPSAKLTTPTSTRPVVQSFLTCVIRSSDRDIGVLDPDKLSAAFLRSIEK